jgi:DNA-binding response OmpR family regulator
MLHFQAGMPVVFVIAEEWRLRAAVRAELRERGIQALGMEKADDAGRAIAAGELPSAIVLDENAAVTSGAALQTLLRRIPTVLIASRTTSTNPSPNEMARKVLFRPVQVSDIVATVLDLIKGQTS